MTQLPIPTIQEREHMRLVRRLYRRPNGVIAVNVPNGKHRSANKTVVTRLINTHKWMTEPYRGQFLLTEAGIAALARSSR